MGTLMAASEYGVRLPLFLAEHVDAFYKDGGYKFLVAKYNFDPSALNERGCDNGMPGTNPSGAVGTTSDEILQGKFDKKIVRFLVEFS